MKDYSTEKTTKLFEKAQNYLPGGVNSVARSQIAGFSPVPPYFDHGLGSKIWDVDGNEYIDYILGMGPLILGHCHPKQVEAVTRAIQQNGVTFGICHPLELEAAEKIIRNLPSVDLVRFANSGTEAVMLAMRLARGYTGKDKIVRFEGHYHGWSDVIHWNTRAPLGAIGLSRAPRAVPGTAGIPDVYSQALIIQPWNDIEILEKTIKRRGHEIAAIIAEPIMCNLGATAPKENYLADIRRLCDENDILLILAEVITAFRLGLSGAQGYFNVLPDITTMAKAIGGGYPVAAVGGKKEIMALMGTHSVSHAGTYNGNFLSMTAVKTTLEILEQPDVYETLYALGSKLRKGLEEVIHAVGLPAVAQGVGPVSQIWFEDTPINDYRDAMMRKNSHIFPLFTKAMYKRGVVFNASQMGVWYISIAHSEKDIDFTINAASDAIKEVKNLL